MRSASAAGTGATAPRLAAARTSAAHHRVPIRMGASSNGESAVGARPDPLGQLAELLLVLAGQLGPAELLEGFPPRLVSRHVLLIQLDRLGSVGDGLVVLGLGLGLFALALQ